MNTNPYSAPSSSVETPVSAGQFQLHDPRLVPIGNSMKWIGDGFGHFKQDIGAWILICIVGFVLMLVLNFIPLINIVASVLTYVWLGGLILGCKAQDEGESITVGHLFAGFQNKFGALVLLGVIMLAVSMCVMFIALGPTYFQMATAGFGATPEDVGIDSSNIVTGFLLPILIAMLFLIPLAMCVWFAPALIVINDVPILKAMKMSFIGCLKNFVPFLLYGIVLLVLYILAAIPLLLGLLVLMPTFFGSIYRSYKDIYIETN